MVEKEGLLLSLRAESTIRKREGNGVGDGGEGWEEKDLRTRSN